MSIFTVDGCATSRSMTSRKRSYDRPTDGAAIHDRQVQGTITQYHIESWQIPKGTKRKIECKNIDSEVTSPTMAIYSERRAAKSSAERSHSLFCEQI
mmetsp:Transcript_14713/g.23855  ORF Transcript_14713/g.23855 Transcript_14713/m.23855 type:complete len:97 (+) Transcript_14713:181-471(+)